METKVNEISINGISYIPKDEKQEMAECVDGLPYKIVRTQSAGVFAGYVKSRNGKEVVMVNARRLWYWSGACSLSQLAVDGTKKPNECKFPCPVSLIELMEAIEILDVTEKAKKSLDGVKIWEQ